MGRGGAGGQDQGCGSKHTVVQALGTGARAGNKGCGLLCACHDARRLDPARGTCSQVAHEGRSRRCNFAPDLCRRKKSHVHPPASLALRVCGEQHGVGPATLHDPQRPVVVDEREAALRRHEHVLAVPVALARKQVEHRGKDHLQGEGKARRDRGERLVYGDGTPGKGDQLQGVCATRRRVPCVVICAKSAMHAGEDEMMRANTPGLLSALQPASFHNPTPHPLLHARPRTGPYQPAARPPSL